MLIDSHCHLDFPDFAEDLDAIMSRAKENGVGLMLTICTHLSKFEQVLAVAERYPEVYCTVGIHPHEAGSETLNDVSRLIDLASHPKVVGFGETGLDYFYEYSPREAQERSFRLHIEAARQTGLPVIIHTRNADEETRTLLAEEMGKGPFTGLVHCFSGGPELAQDALAHGLYLSFSGIVTFKKAEELRQTASGVPTGRVLVETDAPYLAPIPKRGKRNEPAYTRYTARSLAELYGMEEAAFAAETTENFYRLFTKVPRTR